MNKTLNIPMINALSNIRIMGKNYANSLLYIRKHLMSNDMSLYYLNRIEEINTAIDELNFMIDNELGD